MDDSLDAVTRPRARRGGEEMELVLLFAVLICPIVMGGMMVWMWRQMRSGASRGDQTRDERR